MLIRKLCLCACLAVVLVLVPRTLAAAEHEAGGASTGQSPPPTSQASPTISLRVGQRYPIEGVLAQEATIRPENIATVRETSEGLLITALQPGAATLTLRAQDKTVAVHLIVREGSSADSSPDAWNRAHLELRGLPGVTLGSLGGKLVVQGEILGRQAYQRVLLFLRTFPKNLVVLALPAPGVRESLIEQANMLLAEKGLAGVTVSNAGHRFFLEGAVRAPEDVERAYEIVQSVIPNIENHLAVPIRVEPTILVRVTMLELSRHAHEILGLSWPANVPNAAVFTPTSAAFSPSWAVSLNHLSANGEARVLAEPSLAVKVGGAADLSAGGEIPIKITGRFENKVVWKKYGLRIRIRISGMAGNSIRTAVEASSSQLDDATAVDGVPGLRDTTMSTEVDALEGRPILLTGLFQSTAAKDVERVPLLGSIPLIGELFKSRRFRDHESELLVALVPSLGAPEARLPLTSSHGLAFDAKWGPFD